jgi:hypothetical protein
MKRGREIQQAVADRMTAERLAQHAIGRCAWCPHIHVEGTLEHTRETLLQHRLEHHPEARVRKHKRRLGPMHTMVTAKNLDDNIAAVREQGGATWEGAA